MKWFFAVDEAGGLKETGELAKLAVQSAFAAGGLEPALLYHGAPTAFTAWMEQHGVRVIYAAPDIVALIRAAEKAGTFRAHSVGHWLRIIIPLIEPQEKYVLYTDCDVLFLRPYPWAEIRPKIFAAGPEFTPDNWNYFNSGVMVLNVPSMKATFAEFTAHIRARIEDGRFQDYNDQRALNDAYRGHWDRLDPRLNWKPYWDFNPGAALLHFHGPKFSQIEAIANRGWVLNSPSAVQLQTLLDVHIDQYLAWLRKLGGLIKPYNAAAAARLARLEADLTAYKKERGAFKTDTAFMTFKMFPDG
jgi:hypothetical protein